MNFFFYKCISFCLHFVTYADSFVQIISGIVSDRKQWIIIFESSIDKLAINGNVNTKDLEGEVVFVMFTS